MVAGKLGRLSVVGQDAAGACSGVAVGPPWQTLRTATVPASAVCSTVRVRTASRLSAQAPQEERDACAPLGCGRPRS
jgi:hypothetical protein